MRLKIHSRGFSLIELVIVAGLMMVVAAAVSTMLGQTLKASKSVSLRNDFIAITNAVEAALKNPAFCAAALKNGASPSAAPYFNPAGTVSTTDGLKAISLGSSELLNTNMTSSGMAVSELSLTEADPSRRVVSAATTSYLAKLSLKIPNSTKMTPQIFSRDFFLTVTTNTTSGPTQHQVQQCELMVATATQSTASTSEIEPQFMKGVVMGLVPEFVDNDTIRLTAGTIYSDDGTTSMVLTSNTNLERQSVGANGMDAATGTNPTVDGWVSVWLIKNPDTGGVAGLLSFTPYTDIPTAPILPAGYTAKRRLGWVPYDGSTSASSRKFKQFAVVSSYLPRMVIADDLRTFGGTTSKITNGVNNIDISVPPGVKYVLARLLTHCNDSAGADEKPSIIAKPTSASTLSISITQECNAAEGQIDSIVEPMLVNINASGHREVHLSNDPEGWELFQVRGWYDPLD